MYNYKKMFSGGVYNEHSFITASQQVTTFKGIYRQFHIYIHIM